MGMSIYDMFSDVREVCLKVGRGEVNFRYNSDNLSGENMTMLVEIEKLKDVKREDLDLALTAELTWNMAGLIASLIFWWDVVGHDGTAIPLVQAEVNKVPARALYMIVQEMMSGGTASVGEAKPGETMKTNSDATSLRQAKSVVAPSGIPSSSPPSGLIARPGNWGRANGNRNGSNGRKRP